MKKARSMSGAPFLSGLLGRLERRQNLFEEVAIGGSVGGRLFGGLSDLAAFDHDRPVKASGFESFEDRWEIDLAGAELDHDVALEFAAVFGAEAGNVRRDRVDLGDRILARVIDDIAGVVPDREIAMIDLFDDAQDLVR